MYVSQWEEGLDSWKRPNKVGILFKTCLLKSHFPLCKLLPDFANTAMNYVSLRLWSLSNEFFIIQETACSWFVLDYERPPRQIEYII